MKNKFLILITAMALCLFSASAFAKGEKDETGTDAKKVVVEETTPVTDEAKVEKTAAEAEKAAAEDAKAGDVKEDETTDSKKSN